MIVIEGLEQNSAEWLHWRKSHIGASDAPTIMGLNPWRSPLQLWEEKVLGWCQEYKSNMKRGHDMEEAARFSYELMTGDLYPPVVAECALFPFISASFDGMNKSMDKAVEIKCGHHSHKLAQLKEVPRYYFAQLQHQMFVADLNEIDYYSYNGSEGILMTVERDDDFISEMVDMEIDFWNLIKNVIPKKAYA